MVPLTTVASPIAARILAAHLGSEGIVWELRGNVDGPYPLGPVEVLVAADDLDLARELLVAPEPLPLDDPAHDPGAPAPRASGRTRWLVLVVGLLAAALLFGRLLALAGAL
jgi:Putative prokaryotic signal transducing protein